MIFCPAFRSTQKELASDPYVVALKHVKCLTPRYPNMQRPRTKIKF